jgi:hypothetical protein
MNSHLGSAAVKAQQQDLIRAAEGARLASSTSTRRPVAPARRFRRISAARIRLARTVFGA